MIATKTDLEDQRCVPENYGHMLRNDENFVLFRETSAYEDVLGVKDLFETISNIIIERNLYTEVME